MTLRRIPKLSSTPREVGLEVTFSDNREAIHSSHQGSFITKADVLETSESAQRIPKNCELNVILSNCILIDPWPRSL